MRALIIALLLLPGYFALAQNNTTLDQTIVKLQKQAVDTPFEKTYLHMDKPFYAAGDTIWFKGYVLVGQQHHLSGISYVLNVDLINGQNTVIKSIKLPVAYGLAHGDFALPDTLEEGSYRVRAYTNWMRNSGPEYFFDKTITVVNSITNRVFTQSSYSYSMNNQKQTVNAIITYTSLDGRPYTNKDVRYEINLVPQQVAKGIGTTDGKGELHISFTNPQPGTLNSGQITTAISIDSRNTVLKTIAIKTTTSKVDVQFFPESGNLVGGIASKVAFKAVSADGLGADIKGTITDEQNKEVTTFSSTHLGMGVFMLTPQTGKSYKANITYADGTQNSIDLPKVMDKGYVINIDNADSLNNVIVQIIGAANQIQTGTITLLAQAGGDIYFEGKSKPGQNYLTAIIPKSKFPSGIVQFTLFSDSGDPLNERLVFIQNTDKLKISTNTDKSSYVARQKVKLGFNVKDKLNQPVQGNFSVAVTNETIASVDETAESTILSNVLLTSDIKGYIEKPNYYFTNINARTAADLDVLMLTQGYHRFEWKQLINNTLPPSIYQAEKALTISGTVKTRGGKPVAKGKVTLMNIAQDIFLIDTVTDKNGRFSFSMAFPDSARFTVKTVNARGNDNVMLEIDQAPAVMRKNKNAADIIVSLDKGLESYLQNSKKQFDDDLKYGIGDHSIMLKEVNINTTHKSVRQAAEEKATAFSSNLNGKGQADQIMTANDLDEIGGATLWDRLNGRLSGVEIKQDTNGNLQPFSVRSSNKMDGPPQPMQIIVDGIFGRDVTLIPISDIASVEVLKSITFLSAYGMRGGNGVIIVTTKHGGQEDITHSDAYNPGFINYTPKGYYKSRQFYSPKYDSPASVSKAADLRTTIFWNPVVQTDKDGNASFEYFNADTKGMYRVVIEGVDYRSGNIGRQVYHYKVD